MDFDLSDEQRLLRDNVERLAAPAETAPSGSAWSRERWKQFAELGLLALPFAEEDGGLGWGAVETMIVMEAFGKGLVREPYLCDRGDRRRSLAPRLWQRRCARSSRERIASGDLRRGPRACRARGAPRACRCGALGAQDGRGLRARRREERGAAWRSGRASLRQRAHGRRATRARRHLALSRRCQGQGRDAARLSARRRHARGRDQAGQRGRPG